MAIEGKRRWYEEPWVTIVALIFFFPLGLFLMWRFVGWTPKVKWLVTGVVAALFALFVVVGALADEEPEDSTRASAATEGPTVQEATETAEPSQTAEPTDTAEPQPTPEPTATEGPPQLTAAQCAYAQRVVDASGTIGPALDDLSELMFDASSDPLLLFDSDWTIDVAVQVATIQVSIDQYQGGGGAPPAMRPIHQKFNRALNALDQSMNQLTTGVDNLDADAIVAAAALMESATSDLTEATVEITIFASGREGQCDF